MNKSKKLLILSTIILIGFVFGVFYHYILSQYMNKGYILSTFLFDPKSFFCDFQAILPFIRDFAPYQKPDLWINYFPLAYLILFPFSLIKNPIISYLIFASGFVIFFVGVNIKFLACQNLTKLQNFQNIFMIVFMSYPVLYLLDRGNFDMFLFVMLSLFVLAFNSKKYVVSSVCLAVVNAIKPFSWLFLLLFLIQKRYKEFFLSILLTVLMVVIGFLIFKGHFFDQLNVLFQNLLLFKKTYVLQDFYATGMTNNSSLFMALKLFVSKTTPTFLFSSDIFAKNYAYVSSILTLITIIFAWREKVFWKQLTLIACNMLLIPYVAFDYKLTFLFIPLWFFINSEEKSKFDLTYIILFALLLIPKNIILFNYVVGSPTFARWFSLSIIINPLIMLLLSGIIIFEQFYKKKEIE